MLKIKNINQINKKCKDTDENAAPICLDVT